MTSQDLVPPAWRERFVLAMRVRDADGRRIGDALADVEQFCQDSGRPAPEAFGDADEYAATLADPAAPASRAGRSAREAAAQAAGLVGMLLVLWAALAGGERMTITLGQALAVPLVLAGSAVATRLAPRRAVAAGVALAVVVAAIVTLVVVATQPLVAVPRPASAATGVALLLGDALWRTLRQLRRPTASTVAWPWEPEDAVRRRDRRAGAMTAWVFPAMTAVGLLVVLAVEGLLRALA
jgi:hypothetical protein